MKKLIYFLPLTVMTLFSCGGGEAGTGNENAEAAEGNSAMQGILTDLSEYGMDYTIVLPEKKELITKIVANDWGGIEVSQGENFMISIAYGEGDIDLLKFDLEEDLVYKSQVLEEGENFILFKKEIEGSGIDPEFHFLYVHKVKDEAIEVQNLKEAGFNEESARNMLNAAKTFSAKSGA